MPVLIGFGAMSLHFLTPADYTSDPGFIFDIREVLGKTVAEQDIPSYTQFFGPFIKKTKGTFYPDIKGELRGYDFKYGRIETINGMIFGVWYLFKSSFARINGFDPVNPPVKGKETILKSFGFPTDNENFNSNERVHIWEDQFDIRQLQLYREPPGGNNIVSIQAFLIIPWEGLPFHKGFDKKPEQNKQESEHKKIL